MTIDDFIAQITPLLEEDEGYITFLEVNDIIELLQQIAIIPSGVLNLLNELLQHPRLTLGGYRLLEKNIANLAQKIAAEWRLGQTAIGYEDNGATVRLNMGQKLVISLAEEGDGSQRWETPLTFGPLGAEYEQHFTAPDNQRGVGHFRCEFATLALGIASIEVHYLGLGMARKAAKPFIISVLIEEEVPNGLNLDLSLKEEY